MEFWIIFIVLILASLIYRALFNFSRLRKIKSLHTLYKTDLDKFIEESQIALSLFKEAGLKDHGVQVTTKSRLVLRTASLDIPQYQQQNISIFDNLTFNHEDVVPAVTGLFMKAKGIFRHRLKESINPLFWIQYILNLPAHLLKYLGLGEGNFIIKSIQILYWGLGMIKILYDLKLISLNFLN